MTQDEVNNSSVTVDRYLQIKSNQQSASRTWCDNEINGH